MLEGLASGDRMMINKSCARQLATNLLMSIDSRPRGRRYSWELVKYTNKLFYPSIKSHRMVPIDRERGAPIIRQAVVAISSKQRRGVYDAEGRVIPGSEKEMDVVEHVAMATMVFPKEGYMQQDWRLIGIIQPSTLESWDKTQKIMEEVVRST
jgi:protein MBA1